jgi:hypothetical protein
MPDGKKTRVGSIALVVCVCILYSRPSEALAGPPGQVVVVEIQDGRQQSGALDARTDSSHLWLQARSDSIALSFSVPWKNVVRGRVNGVWLSRDKLQAELRTAEAGPLVSYFDLVESSDTPQMNTHSVSGDTSPQRRAKATHIELYASTANWDADVPRDGVAVGLSVRDEHNESLEIPGVLRAELWGTFRPAPNRTEQWKRIGYWTRTIDASDFEHGEATVKLPYPGKNPELVSGYGVEAILAVSFQPRRQGALNASQSIRLRPYERLRDRLEVESGHRFLRRERTR